MDVTGAAVEFGAAWNPTVNTTIVSAFDVESQNWGLNLTSVKLGNDTLLSGNQTNPMSAMVDSGNPYIVMPWDAYVTFTNYLELKGFEC
jgi:hypothetical protein